MYKIKLILLDIDGVVNSSSFIKSRNFDPPFTKKEKQTMSSGNVDIVDIRSINPKHIKLLNNIIKQTNAKIVISSSWKINSSINQITAIFEHHGFAGEIIGATPNLNYKGRGKEIQKWIDDTDYKIDKFVIIDDNSDMDHLMPFLVKTKFSHGLTKSIEDKVIKILTE